jgi:hypothetical protein
LPCFFDGGGPREVVFYDLGFVVVKTDFFLSASEGRCFLQFLHSGRPGGARFGASVGCWKRCFQGYEYKNHFLNEVHGNLKNYR